MCWRIGVMLLCLLGASGCQTPMGNPSFQLNKQEARADLAWMMQFPRPLVRPVVVIGGYLDLSQDARRVARMIRQATGDDRVLALALPPWLDMDEMRLAVMRETEEAFGDQPIDVVGLSMGGLIARDAAIEREDEAHLSIVRLLTISTPHRGAEMAELPAISEQHLSMRAGSEYLAQLDAALPQANYELTCYTLLGDNTVGSANTAPLGLTPYWLEGPRFRDRHGGAFADPRILADILRRLRGAHPWTSSQPAPLPEADRHTFKAKPPRRYERPIFERMNSE